MQETYETNIIVNKWNLEDLLINKKDHNKQLTHISTAINLLNDDSDIDQMRAVLSLVQSTLYDLKVISENDADFMAKMIADASIEPA